MNVYDKITIQNQKKKKQENIEIK